MQLDKMDSEKQNLKFLSKIKEKKKSWNEIAQS